MRIPQWARLFYSSEDKMKFNQVNNNAGKVNNPPAKPQLNIDAIEQFIKAFEQLVTDAQALIAALKAINS